jgi:hypothetical protein
MTMKSKNRVGKVLGFTLRARVTAAFRKIARAVDERTANQKTHDFYLSSGAAWTRSLAPGTTLP